MAGHGDDTRDRPGEAHLARARANFEPIAACLEQIRSEGALGQGVGCELGLKDAMRFVAANTCDVLYAVRHPSGRSMLLRFTMVGEGADRVLFQVQQRSSEGEEVVNGGVVDPHVYHLNEVDDLAKAIRTRIHVFLAG